MRSIPLIRLLLVVTLACACATTTRVAPATTGTTSTAATPRQHWSIRDWHPVIHVSAGSTAPVRVTYAPARRLAMYIVGWLRQRGGATTGKPPVDSRPIVHRRCSR